MGDPRPLIIPAEGDYSAAREIFRAGGIIAFPTETFYGLCVDPFNVTAIEALYKLKGRPSASPIPLIIGDIGMLESVAGQITPLAQRLIERFWPGPLTLVLKANQGLPDTLTAFSGTIGVRLTSSPWARRLSETLSSPITSTSANPSGKNPPVSAEEVLEYFHASIDLLIDGGQLAGTKGSTIVDARGDGIVLIREGEIPSSELFE